TFVTNQTVSDKDILIDQFADKYSKQVRIWDLDWFAVNVNQSVGTVQVYQSFIDTHLHEFHKPGRSYEVSNLIKDPRLFVFLRQQFDSNKRFLELDEILADTLILYCLEDTDPDKGFA